MISSVDLLHSDCSHRRSVLVDRVWGSGPVCPKAWGSSPGKQNMSTKIDKSVLIWCHQVSPTTGLRSVLELRDLRLTVITPLVRTNVNGIKVRPWHPSPFTVVKKWNQVGDGLAMRKPLFESLEEHEWEEVLRKLNKFYTNKENKSEMDKVGLQWSYWSNFPLPGVPPVCPASDPARGLWRQGRDGTDVPGSLLPTHLQQ